MLRTPTACFVHKCFAPPAKVTSGYDQEVLEDIGAVVAGADLGRGGAAARCVSAAGRVRVQLQFRLPELPEIFSGAPWQPV